METLEQEPSFRVELMRLREKVSGVRKLYLIVATITALVALLALLGGNWVVGACIATLSGTLFLAHWRFLDRLRFWALVPAIIWTVPAVAELVGLFVVGDSDIVSDRGPWYLPYQLLLLTSFWYGVPSRDEEALVREHREDWDAYKAGTTPAARRRRAAKVSAEPASGSATSA